MSKVFEALSRIQGELADTILPMVGSLDSRLTDEAPPEANPLRPATQPDPPVSANADMAGVRRIPIRIAAPSPVLPFDGAHWEASEQYRLVRTRIAQHPSRPRMIVISSAGAGDGKSITAINIAGVLALKSEKVLLVDGDFRRSSIHGMLGLAESPGLADVLSGAAALKTAVVQVEQLAQLYVLSAGSAAANPTELLDNKNWPALCAELRKGFDYVILDSPPVGAVADYDLIQAVCDGVILVARPDHTNRRLLSSVLESVPKEKLIGVLLNCVRKWFLGRYTTPDHYYYGAGAYKQ